jgi:CspA family cold shock protein
MTSGTVKWFNSQKGFGFIQPDGGGQDVFVHISAVERAGMSGLNEGQKVSYELEDDRKSGKKAAGNLKSAEAKVFDSWRGASVALCSASERSGGLFLLGASLSARNI